jgi:uncharacterized protein (TIGR02145 family)
MKKIITICAALFITASVFAQAPEKMSYQAVVRDASDNLITNTQIGMQISILQSSASGTAVYVETQEPTTNTNGLVSLEIGSGTVVSGDFTAIDWANGPYFIKTETDPTGGTSYSITGTSQLLSVPYALHAKTAESVTGTITETDPIFGASVAGGITGTDTTYWNNKLDSYTETDPVFGASVASGITGADTASWNLDNDPTNELQQLSVSATGDTLHLQNGGFVIIPGISAANAPASYPSGTVHCSGTPTAVVDVTNPATGKTWMDRNLGASQAATSSTDAAAYGDLYQWGRRADGHQCRNSATTSTLSSTDQPAHGSFIFSSSDWRSPQNTNLWQGVNGVNNPCPSGYRLPTETELNAERTSWNSNNAAGAFASPLKLPVAGSRGNSNGSLYGFGTIGDYWSSTVSSPLSRYLSFSSSFASMGSSSRASGFSVRCLKD